MSLHATFGDGEDISVNEMGQIQAAIHKNTVFRRWAKGDVLLLDNFSTSQGRQPTYDSGRKVAVAWADPMEESNEVVSQESVRVHLPPVDGARLLVRVSKPDSEINEARFRAPVFNVWSSTNLVFRVKPNTASLLPPLESTNQQPFVAATVNRHAIDEEKI